MRVIYVTHNSHLRSTTSSLNAILSELQPRGLQPIMVFREPGPWQKELEAAGVPVTIHPLRVPGKREPVTSFLDVLSLVRLVRRTKPDLIHCNEHEHYPLMRVVGRLTGVPVLATLHWNLEVGYGRWAFRPPYVPACLQFLSKAQLQSSREGLPPEVGPDRVKLLMSGLAIDKFLATAGGDREKIRAHWGAGPNTVVIGVASAIKQRKHLEHFIELISALRSRRLDVLGVIAGGGQFADAEYERTLRALIHQHDLIPCCLMIGNMDPVAPFFQAIDVAINTSEMEILSMSLCEGMALGKPTVAYDVGGNRETVPNDWCVVPFGDRDTLVSKVEKLVVDAPFRAELGESGRRFVRANFDAPILANRQASIYEDILGRRLGSRRGLVRA